MSKRSIVRFGLTLLTAAAVGVVSEAPGAFATARGTKCTSPKICTVSDAAAWLQRWGAASQLPPEQPAPEEITDPGAATLRSYSGLLSSKSGFKGVAVQIYSVAQPNPANPALLEGNYIARAFLFANAGEAKKFRDADAKSVTDRRELVRVGTYRGGILLADTQGLVNDMFPIGNVLVDLRSGVTEPTKMAGVDNMKTLQDKFVATAKR